MGADTAIRVKLTFLGGRKGFNEMLKLKGALLADVEVTLYLSMVEVALWPEENRANVARAAAVLDRVKGAKHLRFCAVEIEDADAPEAPQGGMSIKVMHPDVNRAVCAFDVAYDAMGA